MSLATRLTLLVATVLAACGLLAGAAFYRAEKRALEQQLAAGLVARIAWLSGGLDVELDDGELQLDATGSPAGAAERWEVATSDGRVLWWSGPLPPHGLTRTAVVTYGRPDATPVAGDELTTDDGSAARAAWAPVPMEEVPAAAAKATGDAVPGLSPRRAFRRTRVKRNAPAEFELHGTHGGREYAVRVDAAGHVLRLKDRAADGFVEYALPAGAERIDLVLTAHASADDVRQRLGRLARTLWTFGPVALAATTLLLALLIRWQLRPLARMASQAEAIGPATAASARIDPAGGATELVRLRRALDGMVRRLAEGIERERHFAATAAHELRTPLAQMRTAVEVALRRPREAPEYREALEQVADDVQRLQKLVVGLLQLTRSADASRVPTRPLPLAPLLQKAVSQCGGGAVLQDGAAASEAWVYGDDELMYAALCNVLENASRYAPGAPAEVRVAESRTVPVTVNVTISDHGPGVPEAERERIFQPLTRLPTGDGSASQSPGFGLGLAVARATARAFGGDLVCRGRSDGQSGAEFVLTLPRAAARGEPIPQD